MKRQRAGAGIEPGTYGSTVTEGVLRWRVYTPGLLKEIMNNSGTDVLRVPLSIFQGLLCGVAKRAAELNDKELNRLMLQLALYDQADPHSEKYDEKILREHGL